LNLAPVGRTEPSAKKRADETENVLKKHNGQLVTEVNRNNHAQINELSQKISYVQQEIENFSREYAELRITSARQFGLQKNVRRRQV
jgi:phage shock protein A